MLAVTVDDKYLARSGQVVMTGIQALVRLPFDQHRRDAAAGLRTATLVSGYRGSPLGGLDLAFGRDSALADLINTLDTSEHTPAQPGDWESS